jgi:hypothetical protein
MADVKDAVVVKPSLGDQLAIAWAVVASPQAIAIYTLSAGIGLAVAGVFILAGPGWALIAGATPLLLLAAVLIRGLLYGG